MKNQLTNNRQIILVLSGEIGSGKSEFSRKLQQNFQCDVCKTNEALRKLAKKHHRGMETDRGFLQSFGEKLDKQTRGKWVRDYFVDLFAVDFLKRNFYIVDAIRIPKQIENFRESYGYSVYHIHLKASPNTLENRFIERETAKSKNLSIQQIKKSYREYKQNQTEKDVVNLEQIADLVVDTDKCTVNDIFVRVISFLKLFPPTDTPLVDILVGAQFGSEGKGQIVGHIAPEYDCLLRIGGPNAGHTVYNSDSDGYKDVFHHLPSGTNRNQTAQLILGAGTVIRLEKLMQEIAKFDLETSDRLIIDENAIIISQKDIDFENKNNKISSTGQGVGAATANNIIARIKREDSHKARNCEKLKKFIGSSHSTLEELFRQNKKVLLEGTQGTGLSLFHGIYPFVTSRDTTASGCLAEAGISPKRARKIIMVTRTYPIRVGGDSGPFVSNEIDWSIVAKRSGKNAKELIAKEKTTTTGKDRRVAEFSWDLYRQACELNSPTDIALTFADYFSIKNEKAMRYEQLSEETKHFIEEIERCSGVKVSIISTGFNHRCIIDRRNW